VITSASIHVHAPTYSWLSVRFTAGSTVAVDGHLSANETSVGVVQLDSNTNLHLDPAAGDDVSSFSVTNTTFASTPTFTFGNVSGALTLTANTGLPLGSLTLGNVGGNLTITSNHGFTDAEATTFSRARTVGGTVLISGNLP
jgi:hypothetical protein